MRLAADRIVASLDRLDFADAPVWEAAQQRLLGLLQHLARPPPAVVGARKDTAVGFHVGTGTQAGLAEQVAAAAAAAAAALPALPLEAEGRIYREPRPQKKVSQPDNLIDVSDLAPELPRRETGTGLSGGRVWELGHRALRCPLFQPESKD